MKTIQELHEACITKATAITHEHPYIVKDAVEVYEEVKSIRVLSCYDDTPDITRVKSFYTFRPRNGDDAGKLYGVYITDIVDSPSSMFPSRTNERFQAGLVKLNDFYQVERIVHAEDMAVFNSEIQILLLFYGAIERGCLAGFKYGWGNHRFPKEWAKSFEKSVERFFTGRHKRTGVIANNPAYYPFGSAVQFGPHIGTENGRVRTVVGIVENGAGSYLIHTDYLSPEERHYMERRESINIAHIDAIIKRGTGAVYTPSMAKDLYERNRGNKPESDETLYACQKRAEKELFGEMVASKRFWERKHGLVDFCTGYALTFLRGRLNYGFEYQFDAYRFLANVGVRDKDEHWVMRIDKKKFKRQMKRRHCYFEKMRHLVREEQIDDERNMDDF